MERKGEVERREDEKDKERRARKTVGREMGRKG